MTQPNLYIPPGAISLNKLPHTQVRLLIQGFPGTGKTYSALSAPNPVIVNLDNKLGAHAERDIPIVPFHDPKFVNETLKVPNIQNRIDDSKPPNRRDAIERWLRTEGPRFSSEQTLVVDGWSSLINAVDQQELNEPIYSGAGKQDTFAAWKFRLTYCSKICEILKGLQCHVIVTIHETIERNEDGSATGKLKPLMSGSFADQIAGHFTDCYRMHPVPKINNKGEPTVVNSMESEKYHYKLKEAVEYFWQTKSDAMANCCCSLPGMPMYVRADFQKVFVKKEWI